jgi:membrane protease YdiL (CAAX protease family)
VLLQTMVGLAAAQTAVTWLSPTRVPLIHAARLGGDPAVPIGRASTAALRVLAALLPAMLVASVLSELLATGTDRIHDVAAMGLGRGDTVSLSVLGAAAVVVGPIGEELLFRGLIYRQLRQRFGIATALWVSSLLFAVMHVAPTQLPQYLVLGMGFALAYEWAGSLWASIILHGLWNLGTFVLMVCVIRS